MAAGRGGARAGAVGLRRDARRLPGAAEHAAHELPGAVRTSDPAPSGARDVAIWADCRARFGAGGPFLFGAFSAADAYYAPVVRRFLGFAVKLPEAAAAYVAAIDALPAMRAWVEAGLAEHDFVEEDEPYRERPAR